MSLEHLRNEMNRARAKVSMAMSSRADISAVESISSDFLLVFDAAVSNVANYIEEQQAQQELAAKALLTRVDATSLDETKLFESFRREAEELVKAHVHVRRLASCYDLDLRGIAADADSVLNTTCVEKLENWMNQPNSAFIVVLSDVYNLLRAAETKVEDTGEWVAPTSFERSTTKYWVDDKNLTEVLLAVVNEAPLLVYGLSGRLTTQEDCTRLEGDKLWSTLATKITSVYFDSPSMFLYKHRLARDEGAQLFRVRWYGKKPVGDQQIFLELKTHHEKWVNSKSIKERVAILEKDMPTFLAREQWERSDAKRLVVAADASLEGKELDKATELLWTMHSLVVDRDLRPCVRSTYYRAAFQSPNSNALRLTVDRNITLIDETKAPPSSWCFTDMGINNIDRNLVRKAPYCVFEVKLSGSDMPSSVQLMLETGVMEEAPKFSKYLSGAAAFNSHKLSALPYWGDHVAFRSTFKELQTRLHRGQKKASPLKSFMSKHYPVLPRWMQRKNPELSGVLVEPKSYFANERTFIQWISGALLLTTVSLLLLQFQNGNIPIEYAIHNIGLVLCLAALLIVLYGLVAYHTRVRLLNAGHNYSLVDHIAPTILAATVLAGVIILTFFVSVGVYAPSFLTAGYTQFTQVDGLCEKVSIQKLSVGMESNQPSGDILVDSKRDILLLPFGSSIESHALVHDTLSPPTSMTTSASSLVDQGTNADAFRESRILVTIPGANIQGLTLDDEGRIFAVSVNSVTINGTASSSTFMYCLMWAENDQLEVVQEWEISTNRVTGITYVPSVSGANQKGGSFYVSGNTRDELIGYIDAYDIPSINMTSTTFASNSSTNGTAELERRVRLNTNFMSDGLEESSKIGSIQFLDGVMYILYDKVGIIRAWNLNDGSLRSEWTLPTNTGGGGGIWNSMYLERQPVVAGKQRPLRSSSSPSLVLHIASVYDTRPLEVWSLVVHQRSNGEEILVPKKCIVPV